MSEQQFQGTLASGGTFVATSQGIRIFDPSGNQLASFGREVISGVSRDGQVVTVERYNDTIVTLTTASITDAVGLEQFLRDTITAPQPPPAPPHPQAESRPEHDHPKPVPTPQVPLESEPLPGAPQVPSRPPDQYGEPPPAAPLPETAATEEQGGRRLWLWGCLGCGGLLILAAICVAAVLATGSIDFDEIGGEDATPTPFIIVATADDADTTPTAIAGADEESTSTDDQDSSENSPTQPSPSGEVMGEGDMGALSGVQVTYLGSRTDTGGIFPPDPGNEYLILGFRVENTTAESAFTSTILQFALHNDAGEEYTVALFADIESTLDIELSAGETVEGEVAFEVPEGGGSYIIQYDDLISNVPLQWAVN